MLTIVSSFSAQLPIPHSAYNTYWMGNGFTAMAEGTSFAI